MAKIVIRTAEFFRSEQFF